MNTRLKELRKEMNLTMDAFGDRIGIGKSALSHIENGRTTLTDRNINTICKEFHVNESWLRTGEGEMFAHMEREEKIASFIGSLSGEKDAFKKDFMAVLADLDSEDWAVLEKMIKKMTKVLNEPEED